MLSYQAECFLPAPMLHAALRSVQHLRNSQQERTSHQANAAAFRAAAERAQLPVMDSESHILPLVVGDPVKCMQASQLLFERFGMYVQPINYPTVPMGTERLRCTPGPMHTPQMLVDMVCSLREVYNTLGIPLATAASEQTVVQDAAGCCQRGSKSQCPCAPLHAIASGDRTVEDYRSTNNCPFEPLMIQQTPPHTAMAS